MNKQNVIQLSERRPKHTLEALKRLTGLDWYAMPASLAGQVRPQPYYGRTGS